MPTSKRPKGACCVDDDGDGVGDWCAQMSEDGCDRYMYGDSADGITRSKWYKGKSCDEISCMESQQLGACCFPDGLGPPGMNPAMCGIVTPPVCRQHMGNYLGHNTTCENPGPCYPDDPPPPPPILGSCCYGERCGGWNRRNTNNQLGEQYWPRKCKDGILEWDCLQHQSGEDPRWYANQECSSPLPTGGPGTGEPSTGSRGNCCGEYEDHPDNWDHIPRGWGGAGEPGTRFCAQCCYETGQSPPLDPCRCTNVCCNEGQMYDISSDGGKPIMVKCASYNRRGLLDILGNKCTDPIHYNGRLAGDPCRPEEEGCLCAAGGPFFPDDEPDPNIPLDFYKTCCYDSPYVSVPETPLSRRRQTRIYHKKRGRPSHQSELDRQSIWEKKSKEGKL